MIEKSNKFIFMKNKLSLFTSCFYNKAEALGILNTLG